MNKRTARDFLEPFFLFIFKADQKPARLCIEAAKTCGFGDQDLGVFEPLPQQSGQPFGCTEIEAMVDPYPAAVIAGTEHIFEDGHGAISIPVSSVGMEVLQEALVRAIREEDYELAAQLRDEIARREQKSS